MMRSKHAQRAQRAVRTRRYQLAGVSQLQVAMHVAGVGPAAALAAAYACRAPGSTEKMKFEFKVAMVAMYEK